MKAIMAPVTRLSSAFVLLNFELESESRDYNTNYCELADRRKSMLPN
jgi:hypothetical protein